MRENKEGFVVSKDWHSYLLLYRKREILGQLSSHPTVPATIRLSGTAWLAPATDVNV